MGLLYDKLKEYGKSDFYPLHMPGHKRHELTEALQGFAPVDITEIDGFDNLHAPTEILLKVQQKAAKIYGAEESYYLVNGSSAGILAAISATKKDGKKLLMVRGSHKSASHAVYLCDLEVVYLYPALHAQFGCEMQVEPKDVEEALKKDSEIGAVFIVSPTYEGLHSDIKKIAEIAHSFAVPLIVDAAHGAHLGFHNSFAENAVRQGADLVIMSLHKTLPSPTQTAILHVGGNLVDKNRLRRFLQIYQTSSPSYPFMAAMEEAIDYTYENKELLFEQFSTRFNKMTSFLSTLRNFTLLQEENGDIGKLVIKCTNGFYNGKELYDILRNTYKLQPEMAAGSYVLLMFTIGDSEIGYERVMEAFHEMDRQIGEEKEKNPPIFANYVAGERGFMGEQAVCIKEAWDAEKTWVSLEKSMGRICGEYVNLYPPGRPILVPGERIMKETIDLIRHYLEQNFTVQGIKECGDVAQISVLSKP